MLNLFPATSRNCQGASRRAFLRLGALSGLGLSLPGLLAGRQAAAAAGKQSKDASCILIWTLGGTSHHDTFDPKPDAPASVRGEFGTVATAVPGVRFCDTILEAVTGADAAVIVTEWEEVRGLASPEVRDAMATPLIVDGRNVLDPEAARAAGFAYEGVGRPSAGVRQPAVS